MPSGGKTKHPSGKTMVQLAEAEGMSVPTYKKHFGEQWERECREFAESGKIPEKPEGDALSLREQKLQEEVRKLQLQNEKLTLEAGVVKGDNLHKPTVLKGFEEVGILVMALLDSAESEFPSGLQGMKPAQISEALKPWRDQWIQKLGTQFDKIIEDCSEHVKRTIRGNLKNVARSLQGA